MGWRGQGIDYRGCRLHNLVRCRSCIEGATGSEKCFKQELIKLTRFAQTMTILYHDI